jgi:hypothetical protein
MTEAIDWSLWRWLLEKKTVRKAADDANAALAKEEARVKESWGADLKKAYAELVARDSGRKTRHQAKEEIITTVARIKDADEEAERVRLDAEATFDEADRILSTSLAREGARKAIQAWVLREKAIRKAERLTVEA